MGVGWHGVPGSTGVELGQTELQLAGAFFQHVVDNEFIDGAVVALLQRTHGAPHGSLQRTLAAVEGDPLCLVVLMGRSRVQVELGGFLCILRAEEHLLVHVLVLADVAATDVEGLLGRQGILLAVDDDPAVALAAVHHAEFTVIEEILVFDAGVDIEAQFGEVLQFQVFRHRHGTAEDEAVVVRVGEMNLVGLHHFLHDEAVAQRRRVIVFHVLRVAGRLKLHVLLGIGSQCD